MCEADLSGIATVLRSSGGEGPLVLPADET